MSFQKEIPALLKEGIIDEATAERIEGYYQSKGNTSTNRLFVVFGVLGAILVGLGIILIIAHNWDELARSTKTILAFVPLLIGQALCAYTLYKKDESATWRESTAAFLFFAIGACIALVSQIYHMPGELSSFLFTWAILAIPLIYVMRSSIVSLLYIVGISWYVLLTAFNGSYREPLHFWWLFLAIIPFFINLYQKNTHCNSVAFHSWLIPISGAIGVLGIIDETHSLIGLMYCCLFGFYYLIGHSKYFDEHKLISNGWKITGAIGTLVLLLIFSFQFPWEEIIKENYEFRHLFISPEGWTSIALLVLCCALLFFNSIRVSKLVIKPLSLAFILFFLLFHFGVLQPQFAVIGINVLLLVIGVLTIKEGAELDHLAILNYGMLILAALVTCRFFDADLSFVFRGILFVLVGIGFFAVNYWMLNKRKKHGN